jgi:drug/metabolite transporter (DMT)-like permease
VTDERRALAHALAAVALWSTVATGFELGLRVLEPIQLLTLGTLVSTFVLWLAGFAKGVPRPSRQQLGLALQLGLLSPCLYYLLLFEAYDRLPAQIAQPLNYTWAIVLALLSVPLLGQRIDRRMGLGIATSYAGVVLLLAQGRPGGPLVLDWTGVALALSSAVVWAAYWLLDARAGFDPLSTLAWGFSFASPIMLSACLLGPGWPEISWEIAGYGLWVGAIEMGVTFMLWQRALRLTANVGRIGQLIFLSPFLSLVWISLVRGEAVQPASIAGLGVIVVGIVLARRDNSLKGRT